MPVASTPTDTPISPILQPPAGDTDWVTYQDTDQLLVYEGGAWTTFAVAGANGGTLTATADKGATLNIAFEGTAIEVIYSKGPEGGSFSGQIWRELIDYRNSNWDSYTYGHIFLFEDLMPGSHLLTITNGDGALWIEAIRVRGALLPHDAFEVAPSSVNWPTGSHFYLGQESQELTMLSSPIPYWFYDSVEWVNLPAASNPVVGICYTATLQGEGGIQFAEMGSYLDGYGDPWKSFWWDSSGPGPGTYPTCITDGYLPPNSGWISPAEVCAQACPFATRISNLGDWPKYQDGDYVATWKIGWYRAGTLQISDIRLIYYSSSPPVTETPTPTITPIPTNTPRFTPTPSQTPTITPTPTPTPECPWYGTPEPSGANCLYEYQGELVVDHTRS